jgi:MFS family permease
VSSGLAFKAATGLAVAGMGYMVTLQLQLDWHWPPYLASIGMLPQVVVLIFGGPLSNRFIERVGLERAAWLSAIAVVLGLGVFGLLSSFGYVWIAIALALVAAGIRVNGVVAGTNVLRGLPQNRTSIGAALVDTASEVATAVGIAVAGTVLAALFTGSIATSDWSAAQTAQFQSGIMIAGLALTAVSGLLVVFGITRSRGAAASQTSASVPLAT